MAAYLHEWTATSRERRRAMFLRFREYLRQGYSPSEVYTLMDGHYAREELAETMEARCWEPWYMEYFEIDGGREPEGQED